MSSSSSSSSSNDHLPTHPFVPIAHVPGDIIHCVFRTLQDSISSNAKNRVGELIGWLAVTHVCQSWRDLALSSAQIWSNIVLSTITSMAMVQEFLRRSRGAPLHVRIEGSFDFGHSVTNLCTLVSEISKHTSRLETLHVLNIDGESARAVLSIFRTPAPQLKKLHITTHTKEGIPTLFGSHLPLLREIALTRVPELWHPLRNITRLYLTEFHLPVEKLLTILKNCPTLEIVSLITDTLIGSTGLPHLPPHDVVNLPHLRRLCVALPRARSLRMLTYLSFPSTTHVHLRYSPILIPPMELLHDCTSLRTITTSTRSAMLELSCFRGSRYRCQLFVPGRFTISTEWFNGFDSFIRVYTLFSALAFAKIHSLIIRVDCCFTLNQWLDLLYFIPTLTSLLVLAEGTMILPLFDALEHKIIQDGGDGETRPVMPKLKSFTMLYTDMDLFDMEFLFIRAAVCFRARKEAGVPLDRYKVGISRRTNSELPHASDGQRINIVLDGADDEIPEVAHPDVVGLMDAIAI